MKNMISIIVAICAVVLCSSSEAQTRSPWKVEITDLKVDKVRNRDPDNSVQGVPPDTKSYWIRVTAEFDLLTARGKGSYGKDTKWLDEIDFEWSVVLPKVGNTGTKPVERYSVRTKKVFTYGNISEGEKHHIVIYLHPRVFERHKDGLTRDLVFVRLVAKIGGKTHEEAFARGKSVTNSRKEAARLFPEFRNGAWFESEDVQEIKNALVPRHRTPWVGVGESYYEQIVKEH
jgi:hypothetical protein